jgi:hypothetical protein
MRIGLFCSGNLHIGHRSNMTPRPPPQTSTHFTLHPHDTYMTSKDQMHRRVHILAATRCSAPLRTAAMHLLGKSWQSCPVLATKCSATWAGNSTQSALTTLGRRRGETLVALLPSHFHFGFGSILLPLQPVRRGSGSVLGPTHRPLAILKSTSLACFSLGVVVVLVQGASELPRLLTRPSAADTGLSRAAIVADGNSLDDLFSSMAGALAAVRALRCLVRLCPDSLSRPKHRTLLDNLGRRSPAIITRTHRLRPRPLPTCCKY